MLLVKNRPLSNRTSARLPARSQLMALEARMLFDGALALTHEATEAGQTQRAVELSQRDARSAADADERSAGADLVVGVNKELLVVDGAVEGWQALAQSRASNVDLLVIEPGQDALAQIASRLAGQSGYSAIHVVSHGADGQLFLGARTLDVQSLTEHSGDLAVIGQALNGDADILLYGCDLASGRAGMEFLQALSIATQADVAASTDKTGTTQLGGNWQLEAQLGSIELHQALGADVVVQFNGLLTNTIGDLEFTKSIVQDNVADAPGPGTPTTFTPVYLINNPQSLFNAAGDTSASPLTGPLTNANVGQVESQIQGVDAGDMVRVALVMRNTGTSGLWDICLNDDLPAGLELVAGQDNLRIIRGDGLVLTALNSSNQPVTINDLIRSVGGPGTFFHIQDPLGNTAPALAAGGVTDGSNIMIVTYDARVRSTVVSGSSSNEVANMFGYALSEGGALSAATFDGAAVEIALPVLDKTMVDTSRAFTAGSSVVIGEVVTYEVTLTVPEGITNAANFTDTLPAGMTLVNIESISASAAVSVAGGLPSLAAISPVDAVGGLNNQFTVSLGTITNSNTDNAVTETITIRYNAVVRDVVGNQSGTTLTNNVSFGTLIDATPPTVTVVEPAVVVDMTSDIGTAQVGDTVTYTIVINSNGQSPAFDVAFVDQLPAGLTYVVGSLTQVSGPAPDVALAFAVDEVSARWNQLTNGTTVVLTFQAQINSGAVVGAPIDHQACATYTSLPGHVGGNYVTDPAATHAISTYPSAGNLADAERTGADGVGGAVDDYASKDNAPVTVTTSLAAVMRIVESSQDSTGTRNAYDGSGVVSDSATVGEVVRYRMVVQVPEGGMSNFKIATALPDGIRFVNDGSVTLALVSDSTTNFTSSTLSDPALNMLDAGAASSFADIVGVRPSFQLGSAAIQNTLGASLAAGVQVSGADICFVLGNLSNTDGDSDKEFVVIEFNALISNEALVQSHDNLNGAASGAVNLTAQFTASFTGDSANSNQVTETVIEPVIVDVLKTVSVPSGAVANGNDPTTISYTLTFTNSGTSTAYDVAIADNIAAIPGLTLVNGSLVGAPGGATVSYAGNQLAVSIPSLAAGASVSVTYQVDVASGTAFNSNPAVVTYSSLENSTGDDLAMTVNSGGTPSLVTTTTTQERTSSSGAGTDATSLDNYVDSSTVSLGALAGCLWADLSGPNDNTFNGTDVRLDGITVTLRGAGPDGVFNTGDDLVRTEVTQTISGVPGCYVFTALPSGDYRISVPTTANDPTAGNVTNVFDAGGGVLNDGLISVTLPAGSKVIDQNFVFIPVGNPPDALPDVNSTGNAAGSTASGNVVTSGSPGDVTDTDPNNDPLVVCGVVVGTQPANAVLTTGLGASVNGSFGSLVLQSNGSYVYTVDATNPTVAGLGLGSTLVDTFSYTIKDPAGNTDTTTLTITINGTTTLNAVLRIVESSQDSTGTRNTYDGVGVVNDTSTVGEVVRYRMVVQVPEGTMNNFKIATALPDGLRFVNDGSATVALVGDGAGSFTSSTLSDAALNLADAGTPTSFADITGVRPNFFVPVSAIQTTGGAALAAGVQASGTDVCFVLGNLINSNGDADREFVVIEFNALISNDSANQSHDNLTGNVGAARQLDVDFTASYVGDSITSNLARETVIEPVIVDVMKSVTVGSGAIADPNASSLITYTVTFSNSGTSTAYDVVVTDAINAIPGLTLVNGSVTGAPGGSTVSYAGNALSLQIPSIAAGGSVTLTYQVQVASGTAFASNPVNLSYSSLENITGDDIVVSGVSGGLGSSVTTESNQERTGVDGAGADAAALNNYVDSSTVGLAVLSGCLWADANTPSDNTFNGTDTRLNGVTVTLRGAGADGVFNTGDDIVQTTVTQTVAGTPGCYLFGALPAGDYRITVPTSVTDPTAGTVGVSFDGGTSGARNDGLINVTVIAGDNKPNQDFVYTPPGAANLPPDAIPDTNSTSNAAGSTTTGNVVRNGSTGDQADIDPESQALVVCGITTGTQAPTAQIATGLNSPIIGSYGSVIMQSDGSYVYAVDATNPTVSGLAAGATLTDVFSYTIKDPSGNTDTTTLTITINGQAAVPRPPDSVDRTFTIPEDTPRPLTPGDFAFTDPDVGDSLQCVVINTLPDARQGVLLLNGIAVTVGQIIPAAQLGNLVFDPAPNMNRDTYPVGLGDPNFTFQVCDRDGLRDPTPNKIEFIITPVNDQPDPYPELTRCFAQTGGVQGMDNAAEPGQTVLPAPTDIDLPAQTLTIQITALPTSGTFFLDQTPLAVGQTLTVAQWQRVQFRPDPSFVGPVNAAGAIVGGQLAFNVSDGAGGQVSSRLNVLIKPAAVVPPPVVPPVVELPPVPPVPPTDNPPPTRPPIITTPDPEPPGKPTVTNSSLPSPDLDGGGLFDSNRIMALSGDELLGPFQRQRVVADQAVEAPVIEVPKAKAVKNAVADCDAPTPKAKPKAVKRAQVANNLFADKIAKPSVGFTEQLKEAKQRFKPPVKAKPRVVRPDC